MIATVRRLGVLVVVLGGLIALGVCRAEAQIYRWVDERGVTNYSQGIDSVPERYRATAVPLGFRSRPSPPPTSEAASAPGPSGATVIRFTPGQRIMIDARINGSASARLLLDTGADGTLISPRALAAAGVSLTRPLARRQVHGVTGTDDRANLLVHRTDLSVVVPTRDRPGRLAAPLLLPARLALLEVGDQLRVGLWWWRRRKRLPPRP